MKKYFCIGFLFMSFFIHGALKLTSPAFDEGGAIPAKYTCEGSNVSPALEWSGVPEKTKSLALVVDDPDAPSKVWVHWVVFNIAPTATRLDEGAKKSFVAGSTDFNGAQTYDGPCPPSGEHRYQFTLFALDTMLDKATGITRSELMNAIGGHTLAQTTLIGTYKRKK